LQGHIAEHLGFHYRNEIERQMGVTMPNPEDQLPPEVEAELSKLIATASQQLLQENKGEAAQAQAQEQAKDPLVQMQMKELQIKEKDVQIKEQKAQLDAQAKQAQIANESTRIANQKEVDFARIQADMSKQSGSLEQQRMSLEQQRTMERTRMNLDLAKTTAQLRSQQNKPKQ